MTTILFIHHSGRRGGAGTMLANIIQALDRAEFEPVVVCPDGDVVWQLRDAGAEVRLAPRCIYTFRHHAAHAKPFFSRGFLPHAFMQWRDRDFWEEYIRESGAHIVHLDSITLAPMALAARRAGAKTVCLVQETLAPGLLGLRTAWLRRALSRWADAVVHISEYDRQALRCRAPIVEVIPNWVDLAEFDRSFSQREARQHAALPLDARIVLFLGGVEDFKGTLPLVQAVDRLRDVPALLLVVAGYDQPPDTRALPWWRRARTRARQVVRPDYHRRVMDFIGSRGLGDRIHFVGMTEDVVRLYAAADVVVFPATLPHQARPVLEAGALARPVVVSDFECLREFVTDGLNGLTAPPHDAIALADRIRRILADPQLAARLGEENYRVTCRKHDAKVNAPRFAALYERVAAARSVQEKRE